MDKHERDKQMAELYHAGGTLEKIGLKFGVTRQRVRQILQGQGIAPRFVTRSGTTPIKISKSQRGKGGYIQLLAYVKAKPSSIEAVQKAGLYASQAARIMWALHRCGLLHIKGWRKSGGEKGHYRPVFAYGPGQDAPEPTFNANGSKRRHLCRRVNEAVKPEMLHLADMMHYMREVPCTAADAAAYLGQHPVTVGPFIRKLRAAGLAYVQDWEQCGKRRMCFMPVYVVGDGISKPKPPARTVAEHNAKHRARIRAMRLHASMVSIAVQNATNDQRSEVAA